MSKIILSYLFKTNLSTFRAAIHANNTNRICRILDIERTYLSKELDGDGNTALTFAIKYASPLTVQVLLKQGAQPDQPNFATQQTPLSTLASITYADEADHAQRLKTSLEIATMLLDHDAFVDKPSPFAYTDDRGQQYDVKETPLMTAVRTRNVALVKLLIARKANVNYVEKKTQQRPVHIAVLNGDEAMFDVLESAGAACRDAVADANNTSLHCFCSVKQNDGQQSLLRKLLELGCDVNAVNDQERTPLMLAARTNMVETCEALLRVRAETERVDFRGQRAIDLAELGSDCFRLLLHTDQLARQKSQSQQHVERLVCKKSVAPRRQLSMRITEPARRSTSISNRLKRFSSDIIAQEKKVKGDKTSSSNESVPKSTGADSVVLKTKCKSTKLRCMKQKLRLTKHMSLQSISY